jgi:hypothetical protein
MDVLHTADAFAGWDRGARGAGIPDLPGDDPKAKNADLDEMAERHARTRAPAPRPVTM